MGITQINYAPRQPGPLLFNNDEILGWRLKDMTINGADGRSDLMRSTSHGGAQEGTFERIALSGRFRYIVDLDGTNDNSEWLFDRCTFGADTQAALHVDSAVGRSGDQFLNFWFRNCKDDSNSPLVDLSWGGHVKLADCDHSGFAPISETYKLNLRGTVHSEGVCHFHERGGRYELGSAQAKLIFCEWPFGTVMFDGLDTSSQAYRPFADALNVADFRFSNVPGPKVHFRASDLMGTLTWQYARADPALPKSIRLDHVDFWNAETLGAALKFTELDGGESAGAIPVVHVSYARALKAKIPVVPHVSKNWRTSAFGVGQQFPVSFAGHAGRLPRGSETSVARQFEPDHIVDTIIVNIWDDANTSDAGVTPKLIDEAGAPVWVGDHIRPYRNGQRKVYYLDKPIDLARVAGCCLRLVMEGADQRSAGDVILKVMG